MQSAVLSNDEETIRRAVTAGNADKPDAEGFTPLYFACMKPAVTLGSIEEILRIGATVDARGSDGETPLYIAAFNGRENVVKLLLAHKADVNAPNGPTKETALHAAARFGHASLVALLLRGGADLNVRNARQETALFAAARAGQHETAYTLLEAGANASISNEDGKTPLYIASEKGYKHVVLVLKADKADMRHAKAEADAELLNRPAPVPSTAEVADRAAADKEYAAQARRRSSLPATAASATPMEVVDIHVPQPRANAADALTGHRDGPCRSLEEVGYDMPPPIPKELQNRPPAKLPRTGGTSMVIGTGTEDGSREPIRIDNGAYAEYAAPSGK